MNMSYCRFQNTLTDLRDCYEHFDDELSTDETKARAKMLKLCQDIIDNFGEDDDTDDDA